MQGFFHQQTIETFKRTRIISGLTHGQHKRLCSQSTTLVHDNSHVAFTHLTRDRAEKTDTLGQYFAHKAPQTEAPRIDKGDEFGVV